LPKVTVRFVDVEINQIPALRNPVMVVAFSGWNDAAEAAMGALDHLLSAWQNTDDDAIIHLIAEIDPEEFYDFQVNRPRIFTNERDIRDISWPSTEIFGIALPHLERDLVVVKGAEPSMKWRTFAAELLDLADDLEVSMVVTLGSKLADIPHTRPITVNLSTVTPIIASRLNVELSSYEGPVGILSVIHDGCQRRGIESISMWAPVPHYASNPPSPKASLSLIHSLEDLLSIAIPQDDLAASADSWEVDVNFLANENSDIAEYINALEKSKDAANIADVSGEMIAKEFERYLRRRR
jgi:proteasome assembly chaperone (PAC2) family protein